MNFKKITIFLIVIFILNATICMATATTSANCKRGVDFSPSEETKGAVAGSQVIKSPCGVSALAYVSGSGRSQVDSGAEAGWRNNRAYSISRGSESADTFAQIDVNCKGVVAKAGSSSTGRYVVVASEAGTAGNVPATKCCC